MSTTKTEAKCELCGEPMPKGEEMFKYHGYSGPCPKPDISGHDAFEVLKQGGKRTQPDAQDVCSCDERGIGKRGTSCEDCPRDYALQAIAASPTKKG